ncbi:right-handed parallel beta-helix repeat-containing protein [Mycolicibacterium novocastrense]|nr:right-handed parallel beta-helix repeat-containing protein [Mycolicibacterium novocastrense]
MIVIKVPGVHIEGNGATLEATNDVTSALQIQADGVSLSNLNLTAPREGPRYSALEQHKLVVNADDVVVRDVSVSGSAAAGVFVLRADNFRLDRISVRGSRADGIHMTDGASNGVVNNAYTENTGDDGIAVVSYTPTAVGQYSGTSRNIVVNSPVVNGTTWGQGVTVRGGENVTYRDIQVSGTNGAGVFIASEGAPFFAQSTRDVNVSGGSITGANVNPASAMGAVAVFAEHPGFSAGNITVSDLTITATPSSARQNITVLANGGSVDNVVFRDIRIRQDGELSAIYSNAPPGSYTATGVTVNGKPTT